MHPKHLYHGSSYNHDELKPGFAHSGKEVRWDETESNHFLYASTEPQEAFDQAFASWLERHFQIDRYTSRNGGVVVVLSNNHIPTPEELKELVVFVYTIDFHETDGWTKNNNPHNGLTTEWKTTHAIAAEHISGKKLYDTHALKTKVQFIPKDGLGLEALVERRMIFRTPTHSPWTGW